jgi:anti-sigma28 factor (negative regulator of flagellin synthesis)
MDVRNSLDGWKSVNPTSRRRRSPMTARAQREAHSTPTAPLGNAASEVSQSSTDDDVRPEKVVDIEEALVAGTYNVPASAVASKLVEDMLSAWR